MYKIILALTALCLSAGAWADVQLQIRDGDGRVSTISSNGKQARIEDGQMQGYVIIDYNNGEFLMVDPQRGEVMRSNIGKGGVAVTGAGGVKISIVGKGGGPVVAGYATRKYDFSANGEACGSVYASSKLLENPGIRAMFDSMRAMQRQSRRMMSGMGGLMGACEQASLLLADAMESNGAPMRIVDAKGKLKSEVLKVDTDKKLASDYYRAPSGMKVVNLDEKMGEAMQQTQEMMENMPDVNQLLQQMQQGGGEMSEEMQQQMQQQMKKMQDMLQQLQQQQQ